jgi:ribonuclease HII
MMSIFLIFAFSSQGGATQMIPDLLSLQGRQAIKISDGAVVIRKLDGKIGIQPAKKLSESRREKLFEEIKHQAIAYGIGSADAEEIDQINILQASMLAMKRAIDALGLLPQYLLLDAVSLDIKIPQTALIGGDGLSASIAAASILAKVSRDHYMDEIHQMYPDYGFDKHKGYPTKEHREILLRIGPCPVHRLSYAPVMEAYAAGSAVNQNGSD